MPKAKTSKIPAPVPEKIVRAEVAVKDEREVIYDRLEINEHSTTSKVGPITVSDAKKLMGWETEKEFQERMVQEEGGKPEHYLFGDDFHCKNEDDQKVCCWNNDGNRPFDLKWAKDIADMILKGQYAGPLTFPGETVNGETVRISRYAKVLSGQHQLTALVLANEKLQKQRAKDNPLYPKYPFWHGREECVIETVLITGLSDDERVLRTIDYVKPRTTADMLYTMPLFKEATPTERKELTRMLAAAIEVLWNRTDTQGYKTHPEIVGFLKRHETLLDCVQHIFLENVGVIEGDRMPKLTDEDQVDYEQRIEVIKKDSGRRISKLHLLPGPMSAIMYLMASSGPGTDADIYRNMFPPDESGLDWSLWDRARDFWTLLAVAGERYPDLLPVRIAIGRLMDSSIGDEENQGLGGRMDERLAVLCKAWTVFKDHPSSAGAPFHMDDLADGAALDLAYTDLDENSKKLPDGQILLNEQVDFIGIDWPRKKKKTAKAPDEETPMPPPPTKEEIQERAKEVDKQKADKEDAKKDKQRKPRPPIGSLDALAEAAVQKKAPPKVARKQ